MIKTDSAGFIYDNCLIGKSIKGLTIYYESIKEVRGIKDFDMPEFIIVDFVGVLFDKEKNRLICFCDTTQGKSFFVREETEINYIIPIQRYE